MAQQRLQPPLGTPYLITALGIPPENADWFWRAVKQAIESYREDARPKGHPDGDAETSRRYRELGQAAVSGSRRRIDKAVGKLTPDQHKHLSDLAGAKSGWTDEPTADDIAAVAVLGSSATANRSTRRRAKEGPSPPRTRSQITGGRPARPEIDVLVSKLAAALAGATGHPSTRGSKNQGRGGNLIASRLERLVTVVQAALGETRQWDPVERVRSHVRRRG